ncbi:MAG: hypothetical protein OEW58_12290 [Gammaproteobacteria bacterium]|nr:hypothetical protein [Gammaproteobacteria bacterium]
MNGIFKTGIVLSVILMTGCSAKIGGVVKLVDADSMPITSEAPDNIVVNMINTTAPLEQASHSVKTNEKGEFISEKDKVLPGIYKVETQRIGYSTTTQTIEVGKFGTTKVELFLRKIKTSQSKTIQSNKSDSDKIVNPGEVNIQPPSM